MDDPAQPAVGRVVESARLDNESDYPSLVLVFADGSELWFTDTAQDCCAYHHVSCDDDLQSFTGARFLGWEVADAPDVEDGGEVHEVQFLRVHTDLGDLVCQAHNEHNGYYGGICVEARLVERPEHPLERG